MRRRRRKEEDNPISMILELTDTFWQVGAGAGAFLGICGALSLSWIVQLRTGAAKSAVLSGINDSVGPYLFFLPTLLFLIALIFVAKAFEAYQRQR